MRIKLRKYNEVGELLIGIDTTGSWGYICYHNTGLVLRVSALHYSTGSQDLEGVWTVASGHVLHQPTIVCLGIL